MWHDTDELELQSVALSEDRARAFDDWVAGRLSGWSVAEIRALDQWLLAESHFEFIPAVRAGCLAARPGRPLFPGTGREGRISPASRRARGKHSRYVVCEPCALVIEFLLLDSELGCPNRCKDAEENSCRERGDSQDCQHPRRYDAKRAGV